MIAAGLVWSFCIVFAAVETGGIAVEIGNSVIIGKSDEHRVWFPGLMPLSPTTLPVLIQRAADEINPEPIPSLRTISKDAGRTWTEPTPLKEAGNSWGRRNDGS